MSHQRIILPCNNNRNIHTLFLSTSTPYCFSNMIKRKILLAKLLRRYPYKFSPAELTVFGILVGSVSVGLFQLVAMPMSEKTSAMPSQDEGSLLATRESSGGAFKDGVTKIDYENRR